MITLLGLSLVAGTVSVTLPRTAALNIIDSCAFTPSEEVGHSVSKPRIALVALHFAEYAANLALALAERGEVLLVLYRDNADNELGSAWPSRIKHPSLTLLVLERPRSPLSVIRNTWRLVSSIKRFTPDVIHYQENPRDEIVFGLWFLSATPTVLTVHDPATHSGTDSNRFHTSRLRFYRPVLRGAADIAITHGRVLAKELAELYPRYRGRVYSVAMGPFGLRNGSEPPGRPRDCRLLFFGRINEYKGLRYFVEAIIALRSRGHRVTGVVAGRGPDLKRYRRAMEAAGCFEILDRYIPADEVPGLFLNSLAVVLPYTDGTQSAVAAMALGFGRPVIASAVGSIPELVRDGENGLLIPPADALALTEAIELVITDDRLWNSLAAGAVRLRDGELSWAAVADETFRVYKLLVDLR